MIATCPPSYVLTTVHADGRYVCSRNHENDPRATWPDDSITGRVTCGRDEIAFVRTPTTVGCRTARP